MGIAATKESDKKVKRAFQWNEKTKWSVRQRQHLAIAEISYPSYDSKGLWALIFVVCGSSPNPFSGTKYLDAMVIVLSADYGYLNVFARPQIVFSVKILKVECCQVGPVDWLN